MEEAPMKFYTQQHPHYCGVDVHTRMMYLCILYQAGVIVLHRNMKADPDSFLKAITPFRENIVVWKVGIPIVPRGQAWPDDRQRPSDIRELNVIPAPSPTTGRSRSPGRRSGKSRRLPTRWPEPLVVLRRAFGADRSLRLSRLRPVSDGA